MILRKKAFESKEMYLESILILENGSEFVRAKGIADFMGFSKASVSRALSSLEADGLVRKDENDFVFLTESGRKFAEGVYEKHNVLKAFLEKIGVGSSVAESDACKIEHVISDVSFEMIKRFVSKGRN